jgi:cysteine synthase A
LLILFTYSTPLSSNQVLKAARPNLKIILSEPANAALLTSGVAQERTDTGSPAKTHPAFSPHPIQGWTPDFIPKVTEDGMKLNLCDEVLLITGDESIATSQKLAKQEGIFTGISGGASMATALKVAQTAPPGSIILTMLADTAERYLSTPLFANIAADMNEDEAALSASTPGFQLPKAK